MQTGAASKISLPDHFAPAIGLAARKSSLAAGGREGCCEVSTLRFCPSIRCAVCQLSLVGLFLRFVHLSVKQFDVA